MCQKTFILVVSSCCFRENARHLQWLVLFRQFNTIGPFFCSFVRHYQLVPWTSKTYSKRQNLVQNKNIDVQNRENKGYPLWCFSLGFFPALSDFFSKFFVCTKGSPLRLIRYFATQWMSKKSHRVPLLHFLAL